MSILLRYSDFMGMQKYCIGKIVVVESYFAAKEFICSIYHNHLSVFVLNELLEFIAFYIDVGLVCFSMYCN